MVCPKHCELFSNPINLKLLKTETDLAHKEVSILTMDEKGQRYAQAVGFELRQVPGAARPSRVLDIKSPEKTSTDLAETETAVAAGAAGELKGLARFFSKKDRPAEPQPVSDREPDVDIREQGEPAAGAHYEPQVEQTVDAAIKDTIFPEELEEKIKNEYEQKSKRGRRAVLWLLGIAVVVVLALVFLVLPKATVTVYPKSENVSRDLDITLNTAATEADPAQLVFPADKVSLDVEATDVFQSQGKQQVGSKADGTVVIYNFNKEPIKLKAQTTTLTVNGQNYSLVQDVVQINPTKYSNPITKEVDTSSLSDPVEITAQTGGETGNLPAGTRMEISNQVFGSKPQLLFAKTYTPVTGGVSRYLSVISNQDLASAQSTLKQKALAQLQSKIDAQGESFLDNGYTFVGGNFTADKAAGTQSPTFTADFKATVQALVFKKSDLSKFIYSRIRQSISGDETLQTDNGLDGSYKIKSFDYNAGAAVISAHFESKAVSNVSIQGLSGKLVGKTPTEVNSILTAMPQIDRIDVVLVPSWQKTFPWFSKEIEVKLQD